MIPGDEYGKGERPTEVAPVSPDVLARLLLGEPVQRGPVVPRRAPAPGTVSSHQTAQRPLDHCPTAEVPIDASWIDAGPIIVDIRGRAAFRRGHFRGAVSIPIERLPRSLFLLPPRERPLLLVGRDGSTAGDCARLLAAHRRASITWLDGSPWDLPRALLRPGWEPNRAWEPARLLREFITRLPRTGEAIDLACGSGRDAAFLALHRTRVLGVDILPDALIQARAVARAAGVPPGRLTLRRTDLTDARAVGVLLHPHRFRVISCFRYLDRALLPLIAGALATGGWVIYQTFLEAQALAGRKPRRSAFLLKPGELRRAFESAGGIEIMHYAEGPNERGDHLASLVGRAISRAPIRDSTVP